MDNQKPANPKPQETAVDKQAELGIKTDPKDDGLRLLLMHAARHGDTQLAPAAANILARMDGKDTPGSDYMDIAAPPAVEQQHVGKGEYLGVEVKPEDAAKSPQASVVAAANNIQPIPQVPGKDPVGAPLPLQEIQQAAETASVQPSSVSTAQPVEPLPVNPSPATPPKK